MDTGVVCVETHLTFLDDLEAGGRDARLDFEPVLNGMSLDDCAEWDRGR